VVFFYHFSYILFIILSLILIILLSFISVYHVVIAYIIFMREHLFPSHTHILIRSLLTTLNSHVQDFGHLILFRCSCDLSFTRSWSFSLFDSGILTSFYSCFFTFLYSCISDLVFIPALFIWYHVWMLICDIAVIDDLLWFRFITCSGYIRLSVYTWGIFLAYIHHRLSLRLRFHVFWEAGRDNIV